MSGGTVASEAMSNFALGALEVLLFEEIPDKEVIAVGHWALEVAPRIACLHDHLPLESLPLCEILFAQEDFEVVFGREGLFTASVWAFDWELVH